MCGVRVRFGGLGGDEMVYSCGGGGGDCVSDEDEHRHLRYRTILYYITDMFILLIIQGTYLYNRCMSTAREV